MGDFICQILLSRYVFSSAAPSESYRLSSEEDVDSSVSASLASSSSDAMYVIISWYVSTIDHNNYHIVRRGFQCLYNIPQLLLCRHGTSLQYITIIIISSDVDSIVSASLASFLIRRNVRHYFMVSFYNQSMV